MNTVPRINLAPKLKRPLQLWNPLDYLRLLYWCFFFPQAVPWYGETFVTAQYRCTTGQDVWTALHRDPVLRSLVLHALTLTLVIPLLLIVGLEDLEVTVVLKSAGVGLASSAMLSIVLNNIHSVMYKSDLCPILGNLVAGIAGTVMGTILGRVMIGTDNNLIRSLAISAAISLVISLINSGIRNTGCMVTTMTTGIVVLTGSIMLTRGNNALNTILVIVISSAIALRFPDYLFNLLTESLGVQEISRITLLPLPAIRLRLESWLKTDWEAGLHCSNQLMIYSVQWGPVLKTIRSVLMTFPEEKLLAAIVALAETPLELRQRYLEFIANYKPWNDSEISDTCSLVTIACSGFYHLSMKRPAQAGESFVTIRTIPHGDEMYDLASAITAARQVATIKAISKLAEIQPFLKPIPDTTDCLYPTANEALRHMQQAVVEIRRMQQSRSNPARSQALNRAMGEIEAVLKMHKTLPDILRDLFIEIAQKWRDVFVSVSGEVGRIEISGAVRNPYTLNDPVIGPGFVGREDILRKLEALWANTDVPASVVLYGHRRMGKTSILRNLSGHLGARVHPAYLNLQILGDAPGGVGDVLLAITDAVTHALREAGCVAPAVDGAAFTLQPFRAFEHFLHETRRALGQDRLIIALDEFEELEKWINSGRIPRDFFKVLRSYVQLDPHIAFAFAGLHTLEEMSGNYFEPFFASVIPIRVAFLSPAATAELLANPPGEDFPLDYTPATLERVWELTGGQPFLVQLIAQRLVSRFNDLIFERGQPPASQFTVEDVEAVIADPELFTLGRYYFTGVWQQAETSPPPGQPAILTALTEGLLSVEEIVAATNLTPEDAIAALKRLAAHDVVREHNGRWAFTVELMRRWVAARQATA